MMDWLEVNYVTALSDVTRRVMDWAARHHDGPMEIVWIVPAVKHGEAGYVYVLREFVKQRAMPEDKLWMPTVRQLFVGLHSSPMQLSEMTVEVDSSFPMEAK